MKTKKYAISTFLALFALAVPLGAQAGAYVAGAVSYNVHSYANVSNTVGTVFGVGWRQDMPGTIGVDVSYINAGNASVPGSPNLTLSAIDVSGLYMIDADPTSAMYFKLGGYSANTTFIGSGTTSGLSMGLGFEFSQSRNFAWYTDMDILLGVNVPGASVSSGPDSPFIWTFGARYHFNNS